MLIMRLDSNILSVKRLRDGRYRITTADDVYTVGKALTEYGDWQWFADRESGGEPIQADTLAGIKATIAKENQP